MAIFLETARLILKTPQPADFDNLHGLCADAEVMRYIGTGVRTAEETQLSLDKAIAHYEKHGFSLGAVPLFYFLLLYNILAISW